jgi:glucose-6-phosphate 1-dehydrogenase
MHDVRVESTPTLAKAPGLRAPEACAMVIFGGSGDLSRRKLIPALYNLALDRSLPEGFAVLAVGHHDRSPEAFRAALRESTARFSRTQPLDERVWDELASRIDYVATDIHEAEAYGHIRDWLAAADHEHGTGGNRIFYFATAASDFPVILDQLAASGLLRRQGGDPRAHWSRVVIEKPFGRDLDTARELDRRIASAIDERQVFRIDHYLGKETVQNICVFRFGNAIFEPIWNRKYIDHVQITAAESIGIEGRGAFYDETGVVRDMVQSHLLQILALCAMEPPISFAADAIRDQKVNVLRSLRPIEGASVWKDVVLGQYRGYREEKAVARDSTTPTYCAMRLSIDDWRWQGVPFYLRAGKRLRSRLTEIAIQFQPVPLSLFGGPKSCQIAPNVLTLRIQPDEGITLRFAAKPPGDDLTPRNVIMDFSYEKGFETPVHEAYERLLLDVMRGDATLFWRQDEIESAWAFVTPMLQAFESSPEGRVRVYEPGTDGPQDADALIEADGRHWRAACPPGEPRC